MNPPADGRRSLEIALIGNPNTGKTTLFNRLTGARQRVGNYPGVTVERKTGSATFAMNGVDETVAVIDLPGTYSLAASSLDERVVIDVLMGHMEATARPDLVICVVDATNLMRNLFLASQVADLGVPSIVALNMSDAADDQGIEIDVELLAKRLGVPVVRTVASRGEGIEELRRVIGETLGDQHECVAPMPWPEPINEGTAYLQKVIESDTGRSVGSVELLRILFDVDSAIPRRLGWNENRHRDTVREVRSRLESHGINPISCEAVLRYGRLGELLEGVVKHPDERRVTRSDGIDRILTHRLWGLLIFASVAFMVFVAIYFFAAPLMDGINAAKEGVQGVVGGWLAGMPFLQSLVVNGMIEGVGAVVIFLPQILILFFFIALLEDSGYMARAAFLMDKLFSWCGLSGKSFVPLLSSFACAIPGVMAARTIEDNKARLTTILVAPLMSCSARLPVYVLLIAAFIEPTYGVFWAAVTLFAMHVLGLVVAVPVALILNRFVFRTKPMPFVLEMPAYRMPQIRDVFWRMLQRGGTFLKRAGTVIFAMTIIIWALITFPQPESIKTAFAQEIAVDRGMTVEDAANIIETDYSTELASRYLEQSYMGRFGKAVQPVFAPAGFDWKITVGVLSSFPAREVIIATLGILYSVEDPDEENPELQERMRDSVTPLIAVSIMVFFALCLQCGSTIAVMGREIGWRWALIAFVYMTVLAWVGAVAVYQLGGLLFE